MRPAIPVMASAPEVPAVTGAGPFARAAPESGSDRGLPNGKSMS